VLIFSVFRVFARFRALGKNKTLGPGIPSPLDAGSVAIKGKRLSWVTSIRCRVITRKFFGRVWRVTRQKKMPAV
jgi:hypothetical protein